MTTDLMLYDDLAAMAEPTTTTGDEEEVRDGRAEEDEDDLHDRRLDEATREVRAADDDLLHGKVCVETVADRFPIAAKYVAKIKKLARIETITVIEIGRLLLEVRDLGPGFYGFILAQMGWHRRSRSVMSYTAAARAFGNQPDEILARFQPKAVYLLSARSTIRDRKYAVKQACTEAIAKAEAAEPGSAFVIKSIWAEERIKEIEEEAAANTSVRPVVRSTTTGQQLAAASRVAGSPAAWTRPTGPTCWGSSSRWPPAAGCTSSRPRPATSTGQKPAPR